MTLEPNNIYCGDCLELMKELPENSVDAVVTDPPYEKEAHTKMCRTRAQIEGRAESAAMPFNAIGENMREQLVSECLRMSKGWAIIFCQAEAVGKYRELFGESWRRPMVWIKPDAPPQFTGDRPAMGYESMCAAWCGDGKSVWNGGGKRGVFHANCTDYIHEHPAQKPFVLMTELIGLFANENDLILDPFMGSGTTAIACIRTNRRYIGIEISPEYCEIARKRIEIENMQLKLDLDGRGDAA